MKEKWSTESYRKIREAINDSEEHKCILTESLSGENNGMYGKRHTSHAREKMSKSRTGYKNIWFGKKNLKNTEKAYV